MLVVYHPEKEQQGRRLELTKGVVRLGRQDDNDLVILDDGVSRRHARLERSGDGWLAMDVGSRNGTLLNGTMLSGMKRLQNGDVLKLGSVMIKFLSGDDVEAALWEEMFQLATTDGLTNLQNRHRFDQELVSECARVRRHGRELSLLILDIDHFKSVNDAFGHPAGDAVLTQVASTIRARIRKHDFAARIGGEELAVLMPETSLAGARQVAEELRRAVEHQVCAYAEAKLRVTVSIGCAEYVSDDVEPASFMRRADEQLYRAKEAGRNRVCP